MVLVDAPHVVGDAKLLGHIAQILVVADDAGDINLKFACLPAGQQVVETVAHLGNEDSHTGTLVAIVERELHLIALGIERGDIVVDLVARNEEAVQLPLNAHEEHAFNLIYVLIEVHNVTLVVCDEFRYLCDDALLVGAMQ